MSLRKETTKEDLSTIHPIIKISQDFLKRYIKKNKNGKWNGFQQMAIDFVNSYSKSWLSFPLFEEIPLEREQYVNRLITSFQTAGTAPEKWFPIVLELGEHAMQHPKTLFFSALQTTRNHIVSVLQNDQLFKQTYEVKTAELLKALREKEEEIFSVRQQGEHSAEGLALDRKKILMQLCFLEVGPAIWLAKDYKILNDTNAPCPKENEVLPGGIKADPNLPYFLQPEYRKSHFVKEVCPMLKKKISYQVYETHDEYYLKEEDNELEQDLKQSQDTDSNDEVLTDSREDKRKTKRYQYSFGMLSFLFAKPPNASPPTNGTDKNPTSNPENATDNALDTKGKEGEKKGENNGVDSKAKEGEGLQNPNNVEQVKTQRMGNTT